MKKELGIFPRMAVVNNWRIIKSNLDINIWFLKAFRHLQCAQYDLPVHKTICVFLCGRAQNKSNSLKMENGKKKNEMNVIGFHVSSLYHCDV